MSDICPMRSRNSGAIDCPLAWPQRNSHSRVETLDLRDYEALFALGRKTFGPAGILDCVAGKLAGYVWNLTDDYPFVFDVTP